MTLNPPLYQDSGPKRPCVLSPSVRSVVHEDLIHLRLEIQSTPYASITSGKPIAVVEVPVSTILRKTKPKKGSYRKHS